MAESECLGSWSEPVGLTKKCSLCSNEVTVKSEPFLLPCLHMACRACLPEEPSQAVQCGHCESSFPRFQVVRHLVLIERLEKECPAGEDRKEDARNLCTSCEENVTANGYCRDCEEWLCATCISAHQRVKVTRDHGILSIEQAGQALKTATKQKFQMCDKHAKEHLKYYCRKCRALTCRDCQLDDHKNHGEYLDLTVAWTDHQKPQIKICLERIAERQAYIREYVTQLEKCQGENGQVESRITEEIKLWAIRCINQINKRAKILMREASKKSDQKRKALFHRRRELIQLCKELLDCHATVEDLISSGSDLALAHSSRSMQEHMENLLSRIVNLPHHKTEINMKFRFDSTLMDVLANSCSVEDHSTLTIRDVPRLLPSFNSSGSSSSSSSSSGSNNRDLNGQMRPPSRPPSGPPSLIPNVLANLNGRSTTIASGVTITPKPPLLPSPPPTLVERPRAPISTDTKIDITPISSNENAEPNKSDLIITPDTPPPPEVTLPAGTNVTILNVPTTEASTTETPRTVSTPEGRDDDSEDWCAVCHDGGELLCCGDCPKVYHLHCHVPTLVSTPGEDWKCTLCTPIQEDVVSVNKDGNSKRKIPVGLSGKQLKIAEKILLQLFCHHSSTPFQTPVSRTVPNYFKIITRPMDLSTVKQKLSTTHFNHYESAAAFIQDIKLIFSNCYTFNAKESPLAKQAQVLENYFKELIGKELPECVGELAQKLHLEEADQAKKAKVV